MRISNPQTVEAINQMLASSARCYRWPLPKVDSGDLYDKFMAYRRIGEYMATGNTGIDTDTLRLIVSVGKTAVLKPTKDNTIKRIKSRNISKH